MEHYLTAEISRTAVAHNLRSIRKRLPKGCRLCAVVKADAYGHHLAGLWPTIAAKADVLAVATLNEAIALRDMGYDGRLLTIIACGAQAGGELLDGAVEAARRGIELTVTDAADVRALQRRAAQANLTVAVHVKIDTGMGRSGVLPADAPALVDAVRSAAALRLVGVCTHFAASDEADKAYTKRQLATFTKTLATLGDLSGVERHAANSGAVANLPVTALDRVRVGLAVYGYASGEEQADPLPLRPALRLSGPIVQARRLPAGAVCGYGRTCKLERATRIGIIPFGYADGLPRLLSARCAATAGDALLPVLGRISMDQIIVDLTDAPDVTVGRRVTLISPDPTAPNSVMNLARLAGTIPYEITARLGRRIRYVMVDEFDGA